MHKGSGVYWHSAFYDIVALNRIVVDNLYHLFTALLDKKVEVILDHPRTIYDRREGQGICVSAPNSYTMYLPIVYSTRLLCKIVPWNKFVPQECDESKLLL